MLTGAPGAGADVRPSLLRRLASPSPATAAALSLAVHGLHLLAGGVRRGGDTAAYDYWAGRLIESGFDIPAIVGRAPTEFPALLYVLFANLVAGLKLAFGADWVVALAVLNLAATACLAALVVGLALRVTRSAAGGWAALALFLACPGIAQWTPFALSDSTFCFLAFSIFCLAAARILGERKGWWSVGIVAAAGIFYRPTGIVLVPDLLWAAWLSRRAHPLAAGCRAALAFAAAVFSGVLLFAWLMQDPLRWPFETLGNAFRVVSEGYSRGEVVNARPETFHAAPAGLLDYVGISADRFVHFFAPYASDYSMAHTLAELAFFVPVYGLSLWLLVTLARGGGSFGERERRVFLAATGAIVAYALFHGLVQVDFDWRYRLPVLPHLILLAAGGFADLARRAAKAR